METGREYNEAVTEDRTTSSASIVICAFPGTEEMMQKFWDRMCPEVSNKKLVTVDDGFRLPELLADLVADNNVADDFILIPANCVPCAHVGFEELHVPFVYKDGKGGLHYSHRLPLPGLKEAIIDTLGNDTSADDEKIMKKYLTSIGRPIEASFREGNIVTPVLRGAPCENVVMEAIIRKKYIVANPVGFSAILPLLVKSLLDE